MNLDQLRSFVEVASQGHFTRAAEVLHLAQPSLSRQISTLEQDLGAPLFNRTPGRVALTDAGESLLPLARRMLADADSVRREMAELTDLQRGTVRLGATPSLCVSLVADALQSFHASHPGIDLHVSESGSQGLIEQLAEGALDLALITTPESRQTPRATLTRLPLLNEELVVVSPIDGAAAIRSPTITLEELAAAPQVVFSRGYDLRATAEAAFLKADLRPNVVVEGPEMDAVLRFVELGLGVAVVPAMVIRGRAGFRSARLTSSILQRTVSLAHRSDVPLSRAARAMAATIESIAAAMVGQTPGTSSVEL
ncbi:LysR family transcriptional regulator [Pseudoclavibacter sp. VKM Ac-2867]|uniref:LysR family transcriptional regulator n=1 Tax=Pseudoclavibacter sp. VKM Ac-2867 TaxID=2783829 RepID=UPI00188A0422|nr:LysR substrate-binding domain-containing protein [Pseudoclavibacter sp. VKM Ac-2867]MBF4459045.1 LysR family transcriptional regulator [Pseudoclavibacter sp. VKM Ac-2867]